MFATTLLAATLAAPVPKAKAAELYYPTVEGTKRVMQTTANGRTTETTETVTKVVEKDGKYTVTLTREVGGREVSTDFVVSADGVFSSGSSAARLAEPTPLFKRPAKEGDTWTAERNGPGSGLKMTYTVGKEEEVTVPAGKFKAVPVSVEADLGGRALKSTSWYAPDVGVVKQVSESNGTERVQELKEFTPGKAK